jgi:NADH-quinone oxidoreductase subunit L
VTAAITAAAQSHGGGALPGGVAESAIWTVHPVYNLIVFLPLLSFVLCGIMAFRRVKTKAPGFVTVALLGISFALTLLLYMQVRRHGAAPGILHAFDWINFRWAEGDAGALIANFSFYIDSLTALWMLFVTGLGALIALYATEYMAHDLGMGYGRFFAAFSLFVFSMACLVMGDNLLLLFLGWEGVGLCSYLLIGYFYKRDSAVAAAKKAFVMNRIGDLGLSLGIMLTFVHFGTMQYAELFAEGGRLMTEYLPAARAGQFSEIPLTVQAIPILLMIGAFGKSAQLPLYTWLPDAMEGPTPVSALIHAATMVTAGVYMIARLYWVFAASEHALEIVAWVGGLTALLAATIGMAQFDIKRIMAYSTISQLGYMFAGLGVMTSAGAAFHVFTHAFFKATLFLCCGAVMHGFAGQLDLRKLSGVSWMKGWGVVGFAMLIGCLNLSGFPFTAGFFSKDSILAQCFVSGGGGFGALGWLLLVTAGLTAYYTFRVFFRVFVGPEHGEAGDEVHEADAAAVHAEEVDHHHGSEGHATGHFHPHAPGWAINLVLGVLAVASILAAGVALAGEEGWVAGLLHDSSAYIPAGEHHGALLGQNPHAIMYYLSAAFGLAGILVAAYLHGPAGWQGLWLGSRTTAERSRADALLPKLGPVPKWAQNKWYVDELYDLAIVLPLRVFGHICYLFDKLLVDGFVNLLGWIPRGLAKAARPTQSGVLHDYALRMAGGVAVIVLVVALVLATNGGGAA